MSLSPELEAAIAILKQKSCIETPEIESESEREMLRHNIKLACRAAEWENLGICANTARDAVTAAQQYLQALGYKADLNLELAEWADKPVYFKFNTQKMSHYLDDYDGKYRGVLIAIQAEEEELMGTYGHFPLDLFA